MFGCRGGFGMGCRGDGDIVKPARTVWVGAGLGLDFMGMLVMRNPPVQGNTRPYRVGRGGFRMGCRGDDGNAKPARTGEYSPV